MENLDVLILTSIIATAFVVFIIATYREFVHMSKNPHLYRRRADIGSRVEFANFMGKLFDNKKMSKKKKKVVYQAMFETMADMESDGVRFPEDVKKELIKNREESICEYSGLPSPKSYESL
jgi:hypothetical protein